MQSKTEKGPSPVHSLRAFTPLEDEVDLLEPVGAGAAAEYERGEHRESRENPPHIRLPSVVLGGYIGLAGRLLKGRSGSDTQ